MACTLTITSESDERMFSVILAIVGVTRLVRLECELPKIDLGGKDDRPDIGTMSGGSQRDGGMGA